MVNQNEIIQLINKLFELKRRYETEKDFNKRIEIYSELISTYNKVLRSLTDLVAVT